MKHGLRMRMEKDRWVWFCIRCERSWRDGSPDTLEECPGPPGLEEKNPEDETISWGEQEKQ